MLHSNSCGKMFELLRLIGWTNGLNKIQTTLGIRATGLKKITLLVASRYRDSSCFHSCNPDNVEESGPNIVRSCLFTHAAHKRT